MTRGTLRIYLGAAPGVGKTMAMLAEGRRRAGRGTDVVVGFCETHGRTATAVALEGLEVMPRLRREYRGATLEEMDLDAVLRRAPQVALVDELAHTNVPGGRHEKRWQDVEDLLAAGIDVVSTVNIQHLESLNDAAFAITGVLQRETVPDVVVRRAEQVELIDMAPEALRRRMAHGNVYKPEKVDAALANYFRQGNLTALRELALLWLADRVEESLTAYRSDHDIVGTWPTRHRVVVALSGGREGATLLRRAARIAARGSGGEMHAVFVVRDDGLRTAEADVVSGLRRLTEELGGTFHTVSGPDAAEAVLHYARGVNADQIVVGLSRRSRAQAMLRPGTGERIIAGSGEDIDVHVVTHELAHVGSSPTEREGLSTRRVRLGFLTSVTAPALLSALLVPLRSGVGLPLIVQLYLLLTVVVALIGGMAPAITAGVLSSLLINWFFTPPIGTLTISDPQNVVALVLFVVIGAAVSLVVHASARRAADVSASHQEATALAELSHTMLSSADQLALLLTRSLEMFDQDAAAVVRTRGPGRSVIASTDGYSDVAAQALPREKTTVERIDDEHDLVLVGRPVPAERQRLLGAYAMHAAAVLHRRALLDLAESADTLVRDNKARTALLSAVSHDLRTPLAGIKAAVGSLRSDEVTFSPEDQAELLEAVETSADRLDALIGNLLDASRLQTGALVANPREIDLAEVVTPAVRALETPDRVTWHLDDAARHVVADPGLLDRVLANVLENALRHGGSDGVVVTTSALGPRVELRVADHGPGIPDEAREEIFRPFQRYGDAPAGDGIGLGLAVARGLTEAMGGMLEAETTPGGGVTMVIVLPAVANAAGATSEAEPGAESEPESAPEARPQDAEADQPVDTRFADATTRGDS